MISFALRSCSIEFLNLKIPQMARLEYAIFPPNRKILPEKSESRILWERGYASLKTTPHRQGKNPGKMSEGTLFIMTPTPHQKRIYLWGIQASSCLKSCCCFGGVGCLKGASSFTPNCSTSRTIYFIYSRGESLPLFNPFFDALLMVEDALLIPSLEDVKS